VVERILVAAGLTGTSPAVDWAAEMADRYAAELLVIQVVPPEHVATRVQTGVDVGELAARLAGERGRGLRVYESDEAAAIVRLADDEGADIVVLDGAGMSERTEFLLASVPNRVSHTARCTVVIVNRADGARRDPEPERSEPSDGELLSRAATIGRVFGRLALGTRGDDAAQAQRVRAALEELGPTFGKLGQILSTRPDLLPPALLAELSALQDRVSPLSEAEVVAVMERELGVPWEDVFRSIEPDPMAAGTIAQVHRAVLANGDRVVVKVQRPNAEREIGDDLGLLERFGAKAADRPVFRRLIDVPAIIAHLAVSLRQELDFRNEAANVERMREVLAPFDRLDVPRVYDDLSTAALLVMEEVRGIPVLEAPEGDERREAARQLLESYYQQVFTDGFFHADPHPGNLLWWEGKIYLLDLGMTGEVEGAVRESLLLLLLAFWQEDAPFLADVMLALSGDRPRAEFDAAAFEAELATLIGDYRHLKLHELRLGLLLQQLTEISVRHDVRLPAELALIGKAFGQMQLTAAELDPTLDPFSVAGGFLFRRIAAQARAAANPRRLFYEVEKLRVRATRVLEGIERLVGSQSGATLQVDMPGNRGLERTITRAARRLGLALIAATALAAAAVTASVAETAGWVTPTFTAVGAVIGAALVIDIVRR